MISILESVSYRQAGLEVGRYWAGSLVYLVILGCIGISVVVSNSYGLEEQSPLRDNAPECQNLFPS
jgi:hypothetical protein